jgi:hypothetical protein
VNSLDNLLHHSPPRSGSYDSYDSSVSSRSGSPYPEEKEWSKLISSSSSSRSASPVPSRKRRRSMSRDSSLVEDRKTRRSHKRRKTDKEKRIDEQLKQLKDPFTAGIWDTGYLLTDTNLCLF